MIEESEESRKVMVRVLEENEDNRKMIESICGGNDVEVEQALQNYRAVGREVLGWDQGQADLTERGLRWAVGARKKEGGSKRKSNGGKESKSSTQDRNRASKWVSAMRSSHGHAEEVQASSEGELRGVGRTRPGKAKERVMEDRVNMKAKEEELERNTAGRELRDG